MELTLKAYQEQIRDFILDNNRCQIWAAMGTGKTAAVLAALERLNMNTLIVAPKRVAYGSWAEEVAKWKLQERLPLVQVLGAPHKRLAALSAPGRIFTINYELLPWLIQCLTKRIIRWRWPIVVCDESTRLKNYRTRGGTKTPKALSRVAHTHVSRFIGLSGTPAPNGLIDIWGTQWFVDKGARLGPSFAQYTQRYFYPHILSGRVVIHKPKAGVTTEIKRLLRDCCLDIPSPVEEKPIISNILVQLPKPIEQAYAALKKSNYCEINGQPLAPPNALIRSEKLRQLASGCVNFGEAGSEWTELHSVKMDALASIAAEMNGHNLIVVYEFVKDRERILSAYPNAVALGTNNDAQTIHEWNQGNIPMLLFHPAAAGHGLNLQYGGNIIVFFAPTWNLELYLQAIERIGPTRQKQAGLNRPVFAYNILAAGTIDEGIIARLKEKDATQRNIKTLKKGL